MRTASILAVGNELTEGKIVDTNSAYISRELRGYGFDILEHRTLPDDRGLIMRTLRELAGRVDLVVITGGLGPTVDDMTKECLAEAFDREMRLDDKAWDMLAERFKSYGRTPTDNNRKQAYIPEGAAPFYNTCGTAPGLGILARDTHFCVMPGIPREMEAMFAASLVPYISEHLQTGPPAKERFLKTFGIGESDLGRTLEDLMQRDRDPRVDLTVQEGVITIKLAGSPSISHADMDRDSAAIRERLGERVWTDRDESLAEHLVALLKSKNHTLALAESCTGGLAASGLVAVPGCSQVLIESVVAYANRSKTSRLDVPGELLDRYGAVSEETVTAMASGVRRRSGADIGAAITGIAGPDGGTADKPVGTVWFAVCSSDGTDTHTRVFPGSRDYVRHRSVAAIYWMIREALQRG